MKALVVCLTFVLSLSALAASTKKKSSETKNEKAKVTQTPGPCLTPTPKAQDPFKKDEKKVEPQGFSLQGGDTGCKLQ
ncbi:MAG: hypothetical protein ACOYL6_13405 [Bacteriovoracaceae bacterium]